MKLRTRKVLTLLLVAAMVVSLAVPAFAADGGYSATPYTYDAGDYTFGKISHADKAIGQPDGLVDYTGDGTVAVTRNGRRCRRAGRPRPELLLGGHGLRRLCLCRHVLRRHGQDPLGYGQRHGPQV